MTLQEFNLETLTYIRKNPQLRIGQALFNHLYKVRPDIAMKLNGTENDPFEASSPLDARYIWACEFITDNWGE